MLSVEVQIGDLGLGWVVSFSPNDLRREDSLVRWFGFRYLAILRLRLGLSPLDDGALHRFYARVERLAFLGKDAIDEAVSVKPDAAVQVRARYYDLVGVIVALTDTVLLEYLLRNGKFTL
jgi:hypothetical protein